MMTWADVGQCKWYSRVIAQNKSLRKVSRKSPSNEGTVCWTAENSGMQKRSTTTRKPKNLSTMWCYHCFYLLSTNQVIENNIHCENEAYVVWNHSRITRSLIQFEDTSNSVIANFWSNFVWKTKALHRNRLHRKVPKPISAYTQMN